MVEVRKISNPGTLKVDHHTKREARGEQQPGASDHHKAAGEGHPQQNADDLLPQAEGTSPRKLVATNESFDETVRTTKAAAPMDHHKGAAGLWIPSFVLAQR